MRPTSLFSLAVLLQSNLSFAASIADTLAQVALDGSQPVKAFTGVLALYPDWAKSLNGTLFVPTDSAVAASVDRLNATADTPGKETVQDVLNYHNIPSQIFSLDNSTDLKPTSFFITSYSQTPIKVNAIAAAAAGNDTSSSSPSGTVSHYKGTANILTSIPADNGIIHIIDSLLVPPGSLLTVAAEYNLTALVTAVKAAGQEQHFETYRAFTLCAPNNDAFASLSGQLQAQQKGQDLPQSGMANVLRFHVGTKYIFSTDVKPGTATIDTDLPGQVITAKVDNSSVVVEGAGNAVLNTHPKIIATDLLVKGGIVHTIDNVMLPDLSDVLASASTTVSSAASATATATAGAKPAQTGAAVDAKSGSLAVAMALVAGAAVVGF